MFAICVDDSGLCASHYFESVSSNCPKLLTEPEMSAGNENERSFVFTEWPTAPFGRHKHYPPAQALDP